MLQIQLHVNCFMNGYFIMESKGSSGQQNLKKIRQMWI